MSWSYWPFQFLKAACKLNAVTNSLLSSKASWAKHIRYALHWSPVQTSSAEQGSLENEHELFHNGPQRRVWADRPWDVLVERGGLVPSECALGREWLSLALQLACVVLWSCSCSEMGLRWSLIAVCVISRCFFLWVGGHLGSGQPACVSISTKLKAVNMFLQQVTEREIWGCLQLCVWQSGRTGQKREVMDC